MEPEGPIALVAIAGLWMLVKAGSVAAAIWFDATYPSASERMLNAYQNQPRRCFIAGFVNVFLALVIAAILVNLGPLVLPGLLLLAALAGAITVGYGVGYHDLGRRLGGPTPNRSDASAILLGGAVAEAAFMAPAIGQIFSLTVLFRGLGAVTATLLSWKSSAHASTDPKHAPPL